LVKQSNLLYLLSICATQPAIPFVVVVTIIAHWFLEQMGKWAVVVKLRMHP